MKSSSSSSVFECVDKTRVERHLLLKYNSESIPERVPMHSEDLRINSALIYHHRPNVELHDSELN